MSADELELEPGTPMPPSPELEQLAAEEAAARETEELQQLLARGRKAVAGLLILALGSVKNVLVKGSDTAKVSAARFVLDIATKGPLALDGMSGADQLEHDRQAQAARDAIAEVLGIAGDSAGERSDDETSDTSES